MTFKPLRPILLIWALISAACGPATASTPLPATEIGAPSAEATAAPEFTPLPPAPVETLAPAPRAFSEEFNAGLPYWSFLQIDNGQPAAAPRAEAGFLVFDLPGPNQWVYALYGGQVYTAVRVDARVEVRLGGSGAAGVVCRYTEKDGWYEFNIYPDRTYMLLFGQWLAQGVARYTPLYRGESEKIKDDANEIGLLCAGNTLTPFINGVQMRKWQEQKFGLATGRIGISAASFEGLPFIAAYDWVKVSEP